MSTVIPIFFATEDEYCYCTLVAIKSILEHSASDSFFQFHILVPEDFSEELVKKFEKNISIATNAQVAVTRLDAFRGAWLRLARIKLPTYYRLLIAELFPQYDKVIYLDGDIVVLGDLTELFATVLGENFVGGVPAPAYILKSNREEYARMLGIPHMDKYINAGVLLLNTKKIREQNLSGTMVELSAQKFSSQDQDILNKVLFEGIHHLPFRFNVMTKYASWPEERFQGLFSVEEMREAWASPLIIHYADKIKPWDDPFSPYAQMWWHEASKCDSLEEIILWSELRRKKQLASSPPAVVSS